jgi:Na+/H+ antiporter NhaD/arsenite permease-like protein
VSVNCWPIWATGLGILLAMFYFVDRGNYRRAPKDVRERLAEPGDVFRFEGLSNLGFLSVVLGAAFLKHPPFARELLMVAAATGSYFSTSKQIHESNDFSFGPIKEVAILFVGIFATMIPALGWLETSAGGMGSLGPASFYFGSGALSSVLDNAPTYLTFLSAILGSVIDHGALEQVRQFAASHGARLTAIGPHAPAIQGAAEAIRKYFAARLAAGNVGETEIRICYLLGSPALSKYILAISAGSVFFGANTYIGNGPNFMVKAIADQQKVHTPNFLGYIAKYTLPFMAPMLIVVWLVFFRG